MDTIFSPSTPMLIIVTVLIALVPIILHFFIFTSSAAASLPKFLLLGPSGSGKTRLCLWFEKGLEVGGAVVVDVATTQTSQTTLSLECGLPASICASSQYRSENDTSVRKEVKRFFMVDTPGHAKLRNIAMAELDKHTTTSKIKGLIFVVDSADEMTKVAEYLHDVLLALQKRAGKDKISVLIACNKNDLFTALPPTRIKAMLEKEITRIRESRAKGLRDSGVAGVDAVDADDENEWLGDGGEGQFKMEMMEEVGVDVTFKGGSVEKGNCAHWRQWLGSCL
ncbi:signal recognition particle receptor beta subunit-domain-containing protein [Terfezia claveryi]|nr:signal recognition particle receptor beta subunit-domain-containing protein [Terfezia claveryi]